ncbi:MAG: hypothetical protein AAB368_00960, partial [bacterium]
MVRLAAIAWLALCAIPARGAVILPVAGTGASVYNGDGIAATAAALGRPEGVGVDRAGNVYVADTKNHRIRRIDAVTGLIATVAGCGNPGIVSAEEGIPALSATLYNPVSVAVDASGSVYLTDQFNGCIRRVGAATQPISTFAGGGTASIPPYGDGGSATVATLSFPGGIAVDRSGTLFIADTGHHLVRKVDPVTLVITSLAGTGSKGYAGDGGPATAALLNNPSRVAVDAAGNVYITDQASSEGNQRIRMVNAATGDITTIAGTGAAGFGGDGGPAAAAQLSTPNGIAVTGSGTAYIADQLNRRVRATYPSVGTIRTVAGTGATGYAGDGGPAVLA